MLTDAGSTPAASTISTSGEIQERPQSPLIAGFFMESTCNGIPVIWLLKIPIRVTEQCRDELERINVKLRDEGDAVQNVDRLLRLPEHFAPYIAKALVVVLGARRA